MPALGLVSPQPPYSVVLTKIFIATPEPFPGQLPCSSFICRLSGSWFVLKLCFNPFAKYPAPRWAVLEFF